MLAGCSSSTLLSPRHQLKSESPAQFPACHYQLPSMSTQRLDIPCSFSRKETTRANSIRPVTVGLSVDTKALRSSIKLPPLATTGDRLRGNGDGGFWDDKGKRSKRLADFEVADDHLLSRVKRKRGGDAEYDSLIFLPDVNRLSPGQLPFSFPCSGDDEREFFFIPTDTISPPLLLDQPWVGSAFKEISNLDDKEGESSQRPPSEASGSSTSSGSHGFSLRREEEISAEHDAEDRSGGPCPPERPSEEAAEQVENQPGGENLGFELVTLITKCVEAIGSRNVGGIRHFISKLGYLSSPFGNTAISRLVAYYTEALSLRVARQWPHVFHLTPPREIDRDDDSDKALRLLNQICPIPKFVHYTANEILLSSFEGKDKVHIIDFDIRQGLQWPSLFQSLASRSPPPTQIRITGIGRSKLELKETGDRLAEFAEALNLKFEFHPVVDRLEDVRLWMLHVKENESVAVNCVLQLHKTLYDRSGGAFRNFSGLIKSTNPAAVIVAEQEAEHNTSYFEPRVCNSLKYYSTMFDLVDASISLDSGARITIEEMFGREIRNVIACEGSDRVERHESFSTWKKLMENEGFKNMGISDTETLQSRMLLRMYACPHYSVRRQEHAAGGGATALTLSWREQPLVTVSAWSPVEGAGLSSSVSLTN